MCHSNDPTAPLCDRKDGERTTLEQSFGVFDRFGREIGARAYTFEATFTPNGTRGGYRHPAGLFFMFHPCATRGGEPYGAIQSSSSFTTAEERDAAVAKYFKDARKRAEKTVAAGK
jgi:hypothetical protein